jgi:hypothetical protein
VLNALCDRPTAVFGAVVKLAFRETEREVASGCFVVAELAGEVAELIGGRILGSTAVVIFELLRVL